MMSTRDLYFFSRVDDIVFFSVFRPLNEHKNKKSTTKYQVVTYCDLNRIKYGDDGRKGEHTASF